MIRRSFTAIFLLVAIVVCSYRISTQPVKTPKTVNRGIIATVTGTTTSPLLPPDVQRRYDTFIKVWLTIRDNYFDQTYSNLDWYAIKSEFEPRVKATKTDSELHNILNGMLGRLNKSHLAVIPPEVYQTLNEVKREVKAKEPTGDPSRAFSATSKDNHDIEDELESVDGNAKYGTGIELSLVENRFMITRMDPDSAAEYAGLKLGYIVNKVNGVSLQDMLDRILIYNSSIRSTSVKQFVPAYVVSLMLDGARDSYVSIGYFDENDQAKEVRIRRELLREKTITIVPNFPPQQLSFEARSIDDKTGYIRFNFFAIPVIEKYCEAIREFKSKAGLIIDLRGNTGGVLVSMPILAGMLTSDSIDLGTSIYRTRSEPLKAVAKARNFKGRIVVLVDDRTASAAEMFALSLRENGRALIVGQHTSGEALPSVMVSLPTGAMLLYPFANYRSAGGTFIEGRGIEPDKVTRVDRKAFLAGKDAQLEIAQSILTDQAAFGNLKPKQLVPEQGATIKTDTPPPPPPLAKKPATTRGGSSFTASRPPISVHRSFPPGHDAASNKYIENFIKAIGGAAVIRSLSSLSAKGHAVLPVFGSSNIFKFRCYRDNAEKFSEILDSESTGEIREVINGQLHFVQTDFGMDQDLPKIPGIGRSDLFSPVIDLISADELYPSLSFTGTFDRGGRKTAVVEGKTKDGREIAFAFDAETGMLVNITKEIISISFDDYRKVGNLILPFKIDQSGLLNVEIDEITVNGTVDPAVFLKKQHCFDKVD